MKCPECGEQHDNLNDFAAHVDWHMRTCVKNWGSYYTCFCGRRWSIGKVPSIGGLAVHLVEIHKTGSLEAHYVLGMLGR